MSRPTVELHLGDCLDVLRGLPDGSVDAVVTDPPYSSGGMVRGDRVAATNGKYSGWGLTDSPASPRTFTGDTRDQRSFGYWSALWLGQCQRISRPGGHLLVFTDWRQLPTVTDAVQAGGWVWRGIVVWDKGIARPQRGRFRNHVEYAVWGSNGPIDGNANPVYLDCVYRHAPPKSADRLHLTEKPAALLVDLLAITLPGGTVLDPFMGSGTTGVACVRTGRNFIGVEIDPTYHAIARRRIDAELDKLALLEPAAPEAIP